MLPMTMTEPDDRHAPFRPRTTEPPRIDSRDLLRGGRELIIVHGGEEYRLRRTAQNKLILTK